MASELFAKKLLEAITATKTGTVVGKLEYLRRTAKPGREQELLKRLVEAAKEASWPGRGYQVPWGPARTAPPPPSGRDPEPLSAAAVAWLTRLPSDPVQVSTEDAKALFEMTGRVARRSDDERLLRSIWEPVRLHHERKAAQDEVARLKALPKIVGGSGTPSWGEVTAVLAKAIAAEAPAGLGSEAAYDYGNGEAARRAAEARAKADGELERAVAAAEGKLTELEPADS